MPTCEMCSGERSAGPDMPPPAAAMPKKNKGNKKKGKRESRHIIVVGPEPHQKVLKSVNLFRHVGVHVAKVSDARIAG